MPPHIRIENGGDLFPGFPETVRGAMVNRHTRIRNIISGIILLAARRKDPMRVEKVHSTIHEMKPHESILTDLRFSLTGAVCFSRDIEQTIHHLADAGFLEIVNGSVFVREHVPEFGNYLSGFLTNSQIQAVHSASLRFHERVRRDVQDPRGRG